LLRQGESKMTKASKKFTKIKDEIKARQSKIKKLKKALKKTA